MKVLHTSDWHLGKTFYEHSLLSDQEFFLQALQKELATAHEAGEDYDALIIAGDVYDRAVPPPEAVHILGTFIAGLNAEFPLLHIFMLSGNHDSAERLSFLKEPLKKQNIHIATDCKSITEPVLIKDCAVYQIPYLTPGSIDCGEGLFEKRLRGQQELLDEAVKRIKLYHEKNHPQKSSILCAHLFAAGSALGESERSSVGETDQVDAKSLSAFTYVALGHIHSAQKAAENAWYSGSPLSYSFNETNEKKCFLRVTVDKKTFNAEQVYIKPLHRTCTIKDSFKNILESKKYDEEKDSYIQAICTDQTVIENPMARLKVKFPNALLFSYQKNSYTGELSSVSRRRELLERKENNSIEKIFDAFLKDLYGEDSGRKKEDEQKEKELFLAIAKDVEES